MQTYASIAVSPVERLGSGTSLLWYITSEKLMFHNARRMCKFQAPFTRKLSTATNPILKLFHGRTRTAYKSVFTAYIILFIADNCRLHVARGLITRKSYDFS